MKKNDFLVEIRTEELPPKRLSKLEKAFADNVVSAVKDAGLNFDSFKSFATPRRLALLIKNLDGVQADQKVERKGPMLKAAYDTDDNPTKAALGFAKSCGIDLKEATTLKTDKGEWLYYESMKPGLSVAELMPEIVKTALNQLPISKMMYWGEGKHPFVRPVHNIVMMFGKEVIPANLFDLESNNTTHGHRFHSTKPVKISKPADYANALRKAHVIADFSERKAMIREQIEKLAAKQKATAVIKDSLLDEVTALVEWPVALIAEFDKRFLNVPKEALILAMESHQKSFALLDDQEHLQPFFITISNIESQNPKQVLHGNERVMTARLADAEFFFETDKKTKLEDRVETLAHVLFQKQLGSLQDKSNRVTALTEIIADKINADTTHSKRAAQLANTDLVTEMVGEFPELQGIMGRYYAGHDGEPNAVALALDEQYMPRFSGDQLPTSTIGQALALASRLDTLVGIFGINKAPTGDKDPFALRRATLGILRIIIEKNLDLDLKELLAEAAKLYGDKINNPDTVKQALNFCLDRLKYWAKEQGIRPDVFAAVAAKNISEPLDFKHRLDAVNAFLKLPESESLAAANKRVSNILAKQKVNGDLSIDSNLLKEPAELNLAEALNTKTKAVENLDYQKSLAELASLQQPINQFFDDVMVMTDDEKVRNNRLALLAQLRTLFLNVADISLLQ